MRAVVLLAVACTPARPTHTEVVQDPPAPIAWCVDDQHCKPSLGHCLDNCYKYNHPNGPKHDVCDRVCRETHCERVGCK